MAVTSGFFNSKNRDRVYYAEQMGSIFSGIIRDGILPFVNDESGPDALNVTPGSGLTINIGPGRAWFNDTWMDNNSTITFSFTPPSEGFDRIDAIVIEINKSNSIDTSVSPLVEDRSNNVTVIKGVVAASGSAVRPTLRKASSRQANEISQYALAYVTVHGGATAWATGDIYYAVPDETPYVSGPLRTISSANILRNWQAQFDAAVAGVEADMREEIAEYLGSIGEDVPVAFTQTASGIQCLYTFEEIKTAYNSNNAGITASFNHYSSPNTKLVSKEFKVLGNSNNITGFVFYFYDPSRGFHVDATHLGRRFAVLYTHNSAPTVIDIEHPKSKIYYCIERDYDVNSDGFDGTSYLPKKGLTKTGLIVTAIQGADTNDPADYPRASDIVIGSTGAIAKVTNVYDDGYMYVFDAIGIDAMHTSVIVATFQSSPTSCDVSYADLAAAIQAKQPITAIYQYQIGARSYTIYADRIGSIVNAIGIEFKLPAGTAKFEYTSSGITYAIEYEENKTPYVLEFIGGPSGQPGTNGMFNDVLSAYNNDRPIIAKMEDTNGAMRVTSMYEVASDSSSVTFYFVSIVPTSGSTPSSWTYKCIVYRIMQDDTVIYSGN